MISVIIPALNEEQIVGRTLQHIRDDQTSQPWLDRILLVDGGSQDNTCEIAASYGAEVIHAGQPGRAYQLNTGARAADSDILYFLHADTLPPAGFARHIIRHHHRGFHAGCFQLRFDSTHPLMRFYGWCTRWDFPWVRFGDQSLFVTRTVFEDIGGFDESLLVMEDYEIVSRLKKSGPFAILPECVTTSPRKFEQVGMFRLQLLFASIVLLYEAGASQQMLIDWYRTALRMAKK